MFAKYLKEISKDEETIYKNSVNIMYTCVFVYIIISIILLIVVFKEDRGVYYFVSIFVGGTIVGFFSYVFSSQLLTNIHNKYYEDKIKLT